jgi:uncharacterized membrane protein YfcA
MPVDALPLIACGAVSGLLAGMLGIGGGIVVVPGLYLTLRAHGVDLGCMPQVATATSLAAMIPTGIAASLANARRGSLDAQWLGRLAPGIALGASLGAVLAGRVHGTFISLVFVAYASFFAWRMLRATRHGGVPAHAPQGRGEQRRVRDLAQRLPVCVVAGLIGIASATAGIGGAISTVSYLSACSVDMRRAVAASSAVTVVLALTATFANSLQAPHGAALGDATQQAHMVGSIYWPAALIIGATALVCAPCGVACAHRMPVVLLKRVFALLTFAAAAGTLASVLR